MRSFGAFISKIDWSKSESLKTLFLPFMYAGEEKPTENRKIKKWKLEKIPCYVRGILI